MLATTLAAGSLSSNAAETPTSAWYELRYYRMRTDRTEQGRRTNAFLNGAYLPAVKKAGAGPIGLFGSLIAPDSPFTLCLTSYPSLAAMETVRENLAASPEYQKALADFDGAPDQPYIKMESWLLRAFDFFPAIEVPEGAGDARRPARIFEMRTYQALNQTYLQKKIKMFGSGELGIFKRLGIAPVWFGEAVAGADLPHLTYMTSFENLAAREKAWAAFGPDPDWIKLRTNPEFSMPGLSSNMSISILNPLNRSDIR